MRTLAPVSRQQLSFPSLDFEGRTVVTVQEIAEKLRCAPQHIFNQLGDPEEAIDEGKLACLDLRTPGVSRACRRVPIEAYREWIATKLQGSARGELFRLLPVAQLEGIVADARAALRRKIDTACPA